jgi:predicted PurR-regulated permease PerM
LPDSLKIMSLYNSVASSKQVAANLITATYSGIDAIMYGLTGVQKGYTLQLEEWTEKKAESLVNIPSDINKELKKLKNSISSALSAVSSANVSETLKPFVILGSVALGLYFADKILPE